LGLGPVGIRGVGLDESGADLAARRLCWDTDC